ncbi:D-sedoheptulose-7-phosphate isomerase [Candidatus Pelagibacter sp. HIMB1517]|uniref:D-sedoheptulose-7-phosphate isomerase n=1 Tax=Candidatus Pelagibacter sp. HIMB1517 TaxID=3413341 RepID=UPI003F829B54
MPTLNKNKFLKSLDYNINENVKIKSKLYLLSDEIFKCIKLIHKTLRSKKKVFICGNGGSAADAQHLAAEFLVRLNPKINRKPFPIISLAQDTSTITACANDFGYKYLFVRNLEALYLRGDIVIALTTSGNSENILELLKFTKLRQINTILFLGNNGGKCKKFKDFTNQLIIPSKNVARIQEMHMFVGHFILNEVEKLLLSNQ